MSGLSFQGESDGAIEVKSGGGRVPWHRRQYAYMTRAVRKRVSMLAEAPKGDGDAAISGDIADADGERYGVTDFRSIARWKFAARPFLAPEEQAKMTIGVLHVKVVEARGLMARDMCGKSDPYVKLSLTGRHLSHGQEWSEGLRIAEQTEMVKCRLGPAWNEEFSLPVRRAGAVLRVEVWDWDRGSTDDPLGHFEVKVGEELLSKKPMDMWYVLNAPDSMNMAASTLSKGSLSARPPAGFQPNEGETKEGIGDEAEMSLYGGMDEEGTASEGSAEDVANTEEGWNARWSDLRLGLGSSAFARAMDWKSSLGASNDDSADGPKHSHGPDEQSRFCEACIDLRRKTFGEVRLELRFEFDEFAETCSHIWPEEPEASPVVPFSPNLVYFKAMLLWELAQPYLKFMQGACAVVYWVFPWTSLLCLVAIVVLLLQPVILIIAINGGLLVIVVSSYLQRTLDRPRIASSNSPNITSAGPRNYPINSAEGDLDLSAQGAELGGAGTMDRSTPAADDSTSAQNLYETVDIENSGTPLMGSVGQGPSVYKKATTTGKIGSKAGKGRGPPLLHPEHTAGDREMEKLCRRVGSSKKLPVVVEGVGKRLFPTDGPVIQQQVEIVILLLVKIRRLFRPLEAMPLLLMVFAIMTNACLQLRLRFNVYILVLCVTLFAHTYYVRRGRALFMGIGEAMRCRQVRLSLSKPSISSTPLPREFQEVEGPGSPDSDSAALPPSPGGDRGGAALLPGYGEMPKHLLFAPPGTTPAQEFPPCTDGGPNEDDNARQQRGNPDSVVSINTGGSISFQGALSSIKTGSRGFGRNILGRSQSTPERTTGSIFPTAVAPSPSTVSARGHEGVQQMEEGFSSSQPRAPKEAREETVLREASETSACGEGDGLNTQHYGSVEEKQPKAKAQKWKGSSHIARFRNKIGGGDDQAYGAIAEEEDHDDDDVGEGGGREWRQRVSKWYGNR